MLRWNRIKALMIKEFRFIWSDRRNRIMIIMPPIVQIVIFAFAATLEIKNVSLIFYDRDNTQLSRELYYKFANTPSVKKIYRVDNRDTMKNLIDRQKAFMAVVVPDGFAKNIYSQQGASIQFILDGRKSNGAQIVAGYGVQIVQLFQNDLNTSVISAGANLKNGERGSTMAKVAVQTRNWFNPNLNYQWFITISLCGILAMVMTLMLTSLAVAQEKELGTFDQIIVSPLYTSEILVGKTIPAILITLFDVTLMILASVFFFKVPIAGSVVSLYLCITVFLLSISGIGLSISTLCKTQQQAILGVFTFLAPTFLISGFVTPVENMPMFLQKITMFNPLTYFFILMKGIFLKDITRAMIIKNTLPLLGMSVITLSFSHWYFNRKLD